MSSLRTVPTRRLLAGTLVVAVLGGGGAAAIAATGSGGALPAAKPLANAIHDAFTAPATDTVSARIEFTNKLVDASSLGGSSPILSGAKGRLWASGDKLRLELQSSTGNDAQVLVVGDEVSVYDSASKTVYRATLPAEDKDAADTAKKEHETPSLARIEKALTRLMEEANVSGAKPDNVAGLPAYTVRIGPKHDGGLLGAGELAWDAARGVPLRAAVYAQGNDEPVLELKATHVSFDAVPDSVFAVTPPPGTETVKLDEEDAGADADKAKSELKAEHKRASEHKAVTGVAAVSAKLPFKLSAPDELVGLPRKQVRALDFKARPAALVTYGEGLGAIVVLQYATKPEEKAKPGTEQKKGEREPIELPTVSINGATGQELDTALGTLITFSRGGVDYTVIGSVPPAAAEAAARGL